MGAPLGFKTFATGDVLTAADTNGYLMQGVWTFASATARDAAVTSPQEGNMCYLKDTDAVQYYSGSAWTAVGGTAAYSGCAIYKTATQSIPNITGTTVTFDSEYLDTDGYHSTSTNTGRITIPTGKAGKFLVTGNLQFANNISAQIVVSINKNGAGIVSAQYPQSSVNVSGGFTTLSVNGIVSCAVGDYIEMTAYQASGGNSDVAANRTWLTASFLGA